MKDSESQEWNCLRYILQFPITGQILSKELKRAKKKCIIVSIRSNSESNIDQLRVLSQIGDALMYRIFSALPKLIVKFRYAITFQDLERSHNMAGVLLEKRIRKEIKCFEEYAVKAYNNMPLLFFNQEIR